MPLISSDTIRDISVKSVEMFLNSKVPLSQGLAKQASEYQLNAEQIQRAVEATNSIAYLKVLELATDRTVEFPLCKYAEVMAGVAIPDMSKQASVTVHKTAAVGKSTEMMEKFATYTPPVYNEHEEQVHMVKLASIATRQLQQLTDRSVTIVPELEKAADTIKRDPRGLEKLATIATGKEFSLLSALVYGSVQEHADTGLFKSAELKDVEKISALYKEAKQVQSDINQCKATLDRTELVKEAMFGAIGTGLGKVVGTVAAMPFKIAGKAVKNTATNMGTRAQAAGVKAKNFVTGQNNPIPSVTKKKGLWAVGAAVGAGALDAAMYQPGTTKTGTSKDVWDNLQRS